MHAVVVRVQPINNRELLSRTCGTRSCHAFPGAFVHGYWTWKDNTGLAMVVFESEESVFNEPAGPDMITP